MLAHCKLTYKLELPWNRSAARRATHKVIDDVLLKCYIEFFLYEICDMGWELVSYEEVSKNKLIVYVTNVEEDSFFTTSLPIVDVLMFWAMEYMVLCGVELTSPHPINDLFRTWFERALRTNRSKNTKQQLELDLTDEDDTDE